MPAESAKQSQTILATENKIRDPASISRENCSYSSSAADSLYCDLPSLRCLAAGESDEGEEGGGVVEASAIFTVSDVALGRSTGWLVYIAL